MCKFTLKDPWQPFCLEDQLLFYLIPLFPHNMTVTFLWLPSNAQVSHCRSYKCKQHFLSPHQSQQSYIYTHTFLISVFFFSMKFCSYIGFVSPDSSRWMEEFRAPQFISEQVLWESWEQVREFFSEGLFVGSEPSQDRQNAGGASEMEEERPSCCEEEYGQARSVVCQCFSSPAAFPRTFCQNP